MALREINVDPLVSTLKQLSRYASPNQMLNIYIAAYPTPVDVNHAPHAGHYIVRP